MRTLLIDPFEQTVTVFELGPDKAGSNLRAMRQAVGCQTIDIMGIGNDRQGIALDLVIDDEGRFAEDQRCFRMGGNMLIAGKALIVGHDGQGETIGTGLTVVDAVKQIAWLPEGTSYDPEPPTFISFDSWEMMKFLT